MSAAASVSHRSVRSRRAFWQYTLGWGGLHVFTILVLLAMMVPLVWALISSFKPSLEIRRVPPVFWPSEFLWQTYPQVIGHSLFPNWAQNTFFISILATLGVMTSAALAGYSFARFRFPGRNLLFGVTISTIMLPDAVRLIPTYLLYYQLGWLNTYLPLIVPFWFGGGAFFIFLFRQFFMTIPIEMDEAAKIDGASYLQVLVFIVLPLSLPVMATVGIIAFINNYNSFIFPLIVLNDAVKFTLPIGLRYFAVGPETDAIPKDNQLLAMSVLMTAPIVTLFFVGQRYFVQGVVMSGIKG